MGFIEKVRDRKKKISTIIKVVDSFQIVMVLPLNCPSTFIREINVDKSVLFLHKKSTLDSSIFS